LWQNSTDQQQAELDAQTENTYLSPAGEFQFTSPKEWTIGGESYEEEGLISLQLNGPQNSVIDQAFADSQETESESVGDAIFNQRFSELIETPLGREYALLQIDVLTSAFYELPENIEQWRDELLDSNITANGLSYSKFEDFSVNGAKGYKFTFTIFEGDSQVSGTSYYLLGETAEAEILVYPANSYRAAEAEEIIKTIVIDTRESQFLP